jgi:nicotinate-nucleotide adenylyltransferase
MQKVGIYSGVFDPIHHGHVAFAKKAAEQFGLDTVYFMVEAQPRHKTGVTDHRHRLNMTWLALQEQPPLELLVVDQPTFTVADTLPQLQRRFANAKLYMLLGADAWNAVQNWPDFERLADVMQFVVGEREGYDLTSPHQPAHIITSNPSHLTSTMARQANPGVLTDVVPTTVAQYIATNRLYTAEPVL